MIELVIFDAVGTLLYPREPIEQTYARLFALQGIVADPTGIKSQFRLAYPRHFSLLSSDRHEIADGLARRWIHMPMTINPLEEEMTAPERELLQQLDGYLSATDERHQRESWAAVVGDCVRAFAPTVSQRTCDEIFTSLWSYFASPSAWNVHPQLSSWCDWMAGNAIAWVVASNFDSRLSQVASGYSVFESCSRIYDSASVGFQKPDRRFYDSIAADSQLPTSSLLMIGDNSITDYLAPRLCGWNAHCLDIAPVEDLSSLIGSVSKRGL